MTNNVITIDMTKKSLDILLRSYRAALSFGGKAYIYNDVIECDLSCSEKEDVYGVHILRHPISWVESDTIYEINKPEGISLLSKTTGMKNIGLQITNKDITVFYNVIDKDKNISSFTCVLANTHHTRSMTPNEFKNHTFDKLVDKYAPVASQWIFNAKNYNEIVESKVVTIHGEEYGDVRVSKNTFPFIGVTKANAPVSFEIKDIAFGPTAQIGVNWVSFLVQYKYVEALHIYEFVPFAYETDHI